MKLLKKNQVIIYFIALILMAVAYLNYTTQTADKSIQASTNTSNIGDATLVSSNALETNTNVNEMQNSINTTDDATVINENTQNTQNSNNIESNINNEEEQNTEQTSSNTVSTDDYFTKSKLERETMYSQMLESYENVLNSSNSLETQKQSATEEIKKINDTKNSIMICENLIQTKGFENSIVFVNGDSISIIIKSDEMTQEEVAQVQNIVSREMRAEIENIHISTKN